MRNDNYFMPSDFEAVLVLFDGSMGEDVHLILEVAPKASTFFISLLPTRIRCAIVPAYISCHSIIYIYIYKTRNKSKKKP